MVSFEVICFFDFLIFLFNWVLIFWVDWFMVLFKILRGCIFWVIVLILLDSLFLIVVKCWVIFFFKFFMFVFIFFICLLIFWVIFFFIFLICLIICCLIFVILLWIGFILEVNVFFIIFWVFIVRMVDFWIWSFSLKIFISFLLDNFWMEMLYLVILSLMWCMSLDCGFLELGLL